MLKKSTTGSHSFQPLCNLSLQSLKEEKLQHVNPKLVAAIRAIQAEKMGKEPIDWSDFSSHNKN